MVAASCGSSETEKKTESTNNNSNQSAPAPQPKSEPALDPQFQPNTSVEASTEASVEADPKGLEEAGVNIDNLDTESESDTVPEDNEPVTEEDKKWRNNPKVRSVVDTLKAITISAIIKYGKNKKIVKVLEKVIIKGLEKIIIYALKKQTIVKSEKLESLIYNFMFALVKKQVGKKLKDKDLVTVGLELKESIGKLKISSSLK